MTPFLNRKLKCPNCGCDACPNGTRCPDRVHTWCTGAKYSHDQFRGSISGTISGTGRFGRGEGPDHEYEISTTTTFSLGIDFKRLNRSFNETWRRVVQYDRLPHDIQSQERTPIGDALPDGVTFTASVTPGAMTVINAPDDAPALTPTTYREEYKIEIASSLLPGTDDTYEVYCKITATKHVLYFGAVSSETPGGPLWVMVPQGMRIVFHTTGTASEGLKATYCAGEEAILAEAEEGGADYDVEAFAITGDVVGAWPGDEFPWGGEDLILTSASCSLGASWQRLDEPAARSDHSCITCAPAFGLTLKRLIGLTNIGEEPREPIYETYSSPALVFASKEQAVCSLPPEVCSWGSPYTAVKTNPDGSTATGALAVDVNRYSGLGTIRWRSAPGATPVTLFTINARCPADGIVGELVEVQAAYSTITGGPYSEIVTIDEQINVTEAPEGTVIPSGYCPDEAPLMARSAPMSVMPPKHQPKPLAQGEVVICIHKITSDWNEEGQRILKAGTTGYDGAKAIIEVEAWNASLAHQK